MAPEVTLRAFFRPRFDSDGPSTIDLQVHCNHCRRVFRQTNHGILPFTQDEPIGPSSSSQFVYSFQSLSQLRQEIWISIACLDFPAALSYVLYNQITSFVIDVLADRSTELFFSLLLIADINFVQGLEFDYDPRPMEFIQRRQLAAASDFADENLILGTTTEGPEVDSNGFVDETFILGGTTEGWGGAEGDSDIFFGENFILGMLEDADEDNNAGIEMLERIKRGNWEMRREEVTCSVCLEEFSKGQEVMTTACKHTYHERCLLTWLYKNQTCPLCRRPI